jgi:hypothetical protein
VADDAIYEIRRRDIDYFDERVIRSPSSYGAAVSY